MTEIPATGNVCAATTARGDEVPAMPKVIPPGGGASNAPGVAGTGRGVEVATGGGAVVPSGTAVR